ncbi:MAG: hypothetical protein M3R08_03300 [Bacteroidota bacterium]|nr:hypothetical protein [Bacteroidota bacterium]
MECLNTRIHRAGKGLFLAYGKPAHYLNAHITANIAIEHEAPGLFLDLLVTFNMMGLLEIPPW